MRIGLALITPACLLLPFVGCGQRGFKTNNLTAANTSPQNNSQVQLQQLYIDSLKDQTDFTRRLYEILGKAAQAQPDQGSVIDRKGVETLLTAFRGVQFAIDMECENVANADTPGYKRRTVVYGDKGDPLEISCVFTRGNPIETGIWSDLMIDDRVGLSRSFFRILQSDGSFTYTRNGTFRVDEDGNLRTLDDLLLDPQPGIIPADAVTVTVTNTGEVKARSAADGTESKVGQILLYKFANPAGLLSVNGSRFSPSHSSGNPIEVKPGDNPDTAAIHSGWLEQSNSDLLEEAVMLASLRQKFNLILAALDMLVVPASPSQKKQ